MAEDDKDRGRRGVASAVPPSTGSAFRPESTFEEPSPGNAPRSVGLPSLSAPKGGGAVRSIGEKFAANAATGTASLNVPIATSPGRGGFDLGLELAYDSGAGNGPFGVGWRLGVSSITRKTERGIPRYIDDTDGDVFILSGAEDLVSIDREQRQGEFCVVRYRPRVEQAFARIERWTHHDTHDVHWRTTTGDNVTSIYGRSPGARICDPDDPRRVFSWLLEDAHDDRGNIVRYTYKGEDTAGVDRGVASESSRFIDGDFRATAQRYLKRIEYGNRRPGDPSRFLFEVVFDYGEHDAAAPTPEEMRTWPARTDPFSTCRPGFEVRTYRLCRRVLMFHRFDELGPEPVLVRSTDLEYEHREHLSVLLRVTQAGYLRDDRTRVYERATLPPLELAYIERKIDGEVRSLQPGALDGIPGGVDGVTARWVDLDGEGISGVLLANDRGWYYKTNLGDGGLAPPALLRSLPVPSALGAGVQQLTDLAGEGRLDLVQYAPPTPGYFTRTPEGDWTPFTPFQVLPRIDWRNPNLRFLDVDGDGLADVLVTEHEALVWYRSRGKAGFEPPLILSKPKAETLGAAVVFNDGTETIQLGDMSGDGLVDIVRVRNGEVCYWPNLGHGRFGRKVTMDGSPWFAEDDQFDPRRVRLADLDGSGTIDVIYLGREGIRFYFNESGNRFSRPHDLALPLPDSAASVSVVDLLGNGTACLVWSSPLSADGARPLVYIDVMGGQKPHLLAHFTNGMGSETRLAYASSTAFYLQDKSEGQPWITRLPFPVHLLGRLERYDHVAGTRLITRYRYHHGFYDGVEREYRGFAYVEQWDAETIGASGGGLFPEVADELAGELRLPPVRTRTWFHTGAWLDRERMELALARDYYQADPGAPRLVPPPLPGRLTVAEEREAARALRGRMLRQEIYAEDGLAESVHPYSVTEHTYDVRLLRRAGPGTHGQEHAHAIFFVHAREDLVLYYERRPDDPRVQHQLTLEVDDFGNVLRSAALAYPRRKPLHPEQDRLLATVSEATFVNRVDEDRGYRVGVPIGSATSELTGLPRGRVFTVEALRGMIAEPSEIPFEATASGALERRPVSRRRALYFRDDLRGPLPLGQVDSRALPYETYQQAFTPGLLARVYGNDIDDALLASEARYLNEDGVWWAPSGRRVFEPAAFYQAVEAIDPFGNRSHVRYDPYALLIVETRDPLLNTVTAGDRDVNGASSFDGNDYRVLAPRLLTDANLNRTATGFDALGMPVRSALMAKAGASEGDTLDDPTTRIEYDLHRYIDSDGTQPVVVRSFAREEHGSKNPRWQETYAYIDGSGRTVMRKVQAEPGPVPLRAPGGALLRDGDGSLRLRFETNRWIGTGRTVFDNKGNPVKKYEPFFSDTSSYEDDHDLVGWGVTPILRYDALGRLVRTDLPNGALQRIELDAWAHVTWDENDTVLDSTWFRERGTPDPRGPEPQHDARRRAAWLAAQHAGTPMRAHLDPLGRTIITEEDNKDPSGLYRTRRDIDVSGNTRAVVDARGVRTVDGQVFDMLGRRLATRSPDAGWARALPDAAGKTMRTWNARGLALRFAYDGLQRPTSVRVHETDRHKSVVSLIVYGEWCEDALARNLRTRVYRTYDGAGLVTNERFDFKGNSVETSRRLAKDHSAAPDWSHLVGGTGLDEIVAKAEALLEPEVFTATTAYDALNRVTSSIGPDRTETRPAYNVANLLERLDVRLRGADTWASFVESVDYDARGQRTRAVHDNGIISTYTYERETFRLLRAVTTRRGQSSLADNQYEYDPIGNIVQITDGVSFGNASVKGDGIFTYDPLYRLVRSEGREHPGQQPSFNDAAPLPHPNDLGCLRRYREAYAYDAVGNIERLAHEPLHNHGGGWVRRYAYAPDTSRLARTSGSDDRAGEYSEHYAYDAGGNTISMPHLREMRWDHADRLVQVDRGGGGNVYFMYDVGGQRVRKAYEHAGILEERIYLGPFEIYRRRSLNGTDRMIERQTMRIFDDRRYVALIETKTIDRERAAFQPSTRLRYQIENHLGSSTMEVDEDGQVISHEEFLAFGATAFQAFGRCLETDTRRYRYAGKERDEETGLYYYGARYYAAWLGRWTSVDPSLRSGEGSQRLDQPYVYVQNRPLVASDPDGRVIWFLVAAIVIVGTLTAASPANAPEKPNTPILPRISEAEFATHIAITGASFAAGGGAGNAVLRATGSKVLAGMAGGGIAGLGAPVDLASHDAFRGELSSGEKYATTTASAVAGGIVLGGILGGGSRVLFGPTPPPRLPISNLGGEIESTIQKLPPAGGSAPPEGRIIVGGVRGSPNSPEPRPYPEDITMNPSGGDIPRRLQLIPEKNPELLGKAPEVYFERVNPTSDAEAPYGLNERGLRVAQQLLNQSGGPVRITSEEVLADETRRIIERSGATIVSEGPVEIVSQNASTVGREFLLRYR